jgi:ABC-type transporter Mla MlaB component
MVWTTTPNAFVTVPAMLRTSITLSSDHSAALLLEGELTGAWIDELRATCERLVQEGQAITLDLREVSSIGREGFALLASLSGRGAILTGCSLFQKEQLRQLAARQ